MAEHRVRWTRRALRRLDEIGAYIARDDPNAAGRVVARIVSYVELLRTYPSTGRVGRIGGTREAVLQDVPYIIAYRIIGDEIAILTLMHTSQKWPLEL